jgi:hypothetical protein
VNRTQHRWPPAVIDRARRLNEAGHCDRAVAERMADVFGDGPAAARKAKRLRQRFDWPRHPDPTARSRSLAGQRRALGVPHSAAVKALAFRRFAEASGWPGDLPPRAVQVLNALWAGGRPMTLEQLAAAVGTRTDRRNEKGHRIYLKSCPYATGHTSYPALLMARGLVARYRDGNRPRLYALTAHAYAVRRPAAPTEDHR